MEKTRKFSMFLIIILFMITLVGCGDNESDPDDEGDEKKQEVADVKTPEEVLKNLPNFHIIMKFSGPGVEDNILTFLKTEQGYLFASSEEHGTLIDKVNKKYYEIDFVNKTKDYNSFISINDEIIATFDSIFYNSFIIGDFYKDNTSYTKNSNYTFLGRSCTEYVFTHTYTTYVNKIYIDNTTKYCLKWFYSFTNDNVTTSGGWEATKFDIGNASLEPYLNYANAYAD